MFPDRHQLVSVRRGCYITSSDCSGERGLGIVLEKPWKKLNWRVGRRGARAPAVARPHPGHEPKVGARLRLRQRAKT